MTGTVRGGTAAVTVAAAALMVFVLLPAGVGAASPAASASSATASAVYGLVKTVSVGPLTTATGWLYQGTATIGYTVNATELTSPSPSDPDFELSVDRTMGFLFSLTFCYRSCSSAIATADLFYHAWESTDSFANLTTQGTVYEGGQPVAALALHNESSSLHANVTEKASSAIPAGGLSAGGPLVDRSKYLSAAVSAKSNVLFASPLGLIPLTLTSAQSWNASSAFSATGNASYAYYYHAVRPVLGNVTTVNSGELPFSTSGTVNVSGYYSPDVTVTFGGVTYPALRLSLVGPFAVREGFILAPSSADLFSSTSSTEELLSAEQNGTATVSLDYLDASASAQGLRLGASSWLYASAAGNPGETTSIGSAGTIGTAAAPASASDPIASGTLQGAPESANQATSGQQCLTSGAGCPSATVPSARGLLSEFALVGLIFVVAAAIALVFVAERRRMPPPAYPNANLYPPGLSAARRSPPPTVTTPETPPTPPAEEDPLDHLW